jgi:hypothetical protein
MPIIDPRTWATGDPLDHARNKSARDDFLKTRKRTPLGERLMRKPRAAEPKAVDTPAVETAPTVAPEPPTTGGLGR